jgi:hypothetical protein
MRKILCYFGWHSWTEGKPGKSTVCKYCGKPFRLDNKNIPWT